jgi:prepilin-type N-terminal cleavage/methylation domain-containing protein
MRNQKQEARSKKQGGASSAIRRGFSLVEVLLAMFILGIGMIMVASVFPVGANWTRETTEESVAQTIVQDALTVIKTHYGSNGNLRNYFNSDYLAYDSTTGDLVSNGNNFNTILQIQDYATMTIGGTQFRVPGPFVVQALPGFGAIPFEERAYQFGSSRPFPVPYNGWRNCTYFWTALARLNPVHRNPGWDPMTKAATDFTNGIIPSSSYSYDIYILVSRKGAIEQIFSANGPTGGYELSNTRMAPPLLTDRLVSMLPNNPAVLIPSVAQWNYIPGVYSGGSTWDTPAQPAIGENGIGMVSGTVFRQALNTDTTDPTAYKSAAPHPDLIRDPTSRQVVEPVIYSPPADNTTASPLIYIYQTTLTF